MKTKKELTIYDVENWAKEVEKFPTRQLTKEEAMKWAQNWLNLETMKFNERNNALCKEHDEEI